MPTRLIYREPMAYPPLFNVADLSPYFDEAEELPSLRTNSSQVGKDDGDHLNHKSMSVHAQVSSKETDILVGYSEPTPPNTTRNWPNFVTLVS